MSDDKSQSNDHNMLSEEEHMEPVYATLHFYYDDPDSMERFQHCIEADKVRFAIQSYANWLRNKIKYEYSYDDPKLTEAWHKLFDCFNEWDIKVPGWE